jgi:hypothetical protein
MGRAFALPTWGNTYIFPGGRDDPEILRLEKLYEGIPNYFMEKCGAVPAPPLGVIFRDFSYLKHVKEKARFNKVLPVYLGIDPGHAGPSAYAVVACQFKPDPEILEMQNQGLEVLDPIDYCHVIDVIYLPGAQFELIEDVIQDKLWFSNVAGGAIDCEAPDERKRWRTFLGVPLVAKKVPVVEGERRLQVFLHGDEPHVIFSPDIPSTPLMEFSRYRSAVDSPDQLLLKPSRSARNRRGPEHMLKALWYLLYARYGPVRGRKLPQPYIRDAWRRMKEAFISGRSSFVQ